MYEAVGDMERIASILVDNARMNMQFRVTTSPSIIRIITMRDLLIFRKNITTSASTGCMRLILSISIRSLRTVDFFRLQEVNWKNYVN